MKRGLVLAGVISMRTCGGKPGWRGKRVVWDGTAGPMRKGRGQGLKIRSLFSFGLL